MGLVSKVKIFHGYDAETLSSDVNQWIETNRPEIISRDTRVAGESGEHRRFVMVVTVWYHEGAGKKAAGFHLD